MEDYYYLNQSGCIEIPQFSDKKKFENLKLAMTVLNMMPHDLDGIFKLLSDIRNLMIIPASNHTILSSYC